MRPAFSKRGDQLIRWLCLGAGVLDAADVHAGRPLRPEQGDGDRQQAAVEAAAAVTGLRPAHYFGSGKAGAEHDQGLEQRDAVRGPALPHPPRGAAVTGAADRRVRRGGGPTQVPAARLLRHHHHRTRHNAGPWRFEQRGRRGVAGVPEAARPVLRILL